MTLRGGDTVEEMGGPVQRVGWDAAPHLYFNPGPARIPHHHRGILGYCKALGVPLEVLVNENRAALVDAPGGPVPLRRVQADLRGVVSELAVKGLGAGGLGLPVTEADLVRLRQALRFWGGLDAELRYRGNSRAGWAEGPGAGLAPPKPNAPLDPRVLMSRERVALGELRGGDRLSGDDAAAGGRDGPHRRRLRTGAGRCGGDRRGGAGAASCRWWRAGDLARRRWRGAGGSGAARAAGDAGAGAGEPRHRFFCGAAGGTRRAAVFAGGKARLPGQAAVLGGGCGDLWRHLLDRAGCDAGLVPQPWLPRRAGRAGRRLYLGRRCRSALRVAQPGGTGRGDGGGRGGVASRHMRGRSLPPSRSPGRGCRGRAAPGRSGRLHSERTSIRCCARPRGLTTSPASTSPGSPAGRRARSSPPGTPSKAWRTHKNR